MRLPVLTGATVAERSALALASPRAGGDGAHGALIAARRERGELAPRFVLGAGGAELLELLAAHPDGAPAVAGALPERFLEELRVALRRLSRRLTLAVGNPTRVFLHTRGVEWFRRQGIDLRVLQPIDLRALTVNPVAPQSHSFDSAQLRAALAGELDGLPDARRLPPRLPGRARAAVAVRGCWRVGCARRAGRGDHRVRARARVRPLAAAQGTRARTKPRGLAPDGRREVLEQSYPRCLRVASTPGNDHPGIAFAPGGERLLQSLVRVRIEIAGDLRDRDEPGDRRGDARIRVLSVE